MRKKFVASIFALLAASSAATQTPPGPQPQKPPAQSDTPALQNRLFSSDTSSYDVKLPLGRFAIVDRQQGVVTEFLEKGRFACDPQKAIDTAIAPPLKPSPATSSVVDNKYSGSLSIFVVSAEMSSEEREELTVTDIAQADVTNACQLRRDSIYRIARSLVGSEGKSVIWVSGATLSNLNKRRYSKQAGGIGGSAGSWLSIGADGYKGSDKIDSVPILALRGYIVDVPARGLLSTAGGNVRRFTGLQDVGLTSGYRAARAGTKVP